MSANYPPELQPSAFEVLGADSDKIEVPKATPVFCSWRGTPPGDDYGGKAILDFEGEPVFAEIAILRAFERSGWEGVWVDSFRGGRYRRTCWDGTYVPALPSGAAGLLDQIRSVATSRARCWDVFCWRPDGSQVFAEAKRGGRDRMRASQLEWLRAALKVGIQATEFLVVEWQLELDESAV